MKLTKYTFIAAIALAGAFSACSDDNDYTPGSPAAGDEVYFPMTAASTITLDQDATSFDVRLLRIRYEDELIVNIEATDPSGLFDIPSVVTFAAGEKEAKITIGYDPVELVFDELHTIKLAIANDEVKTPYGMPTYEFNAGKMAPWKPLGKGKYADFFYSDEFYDVVIEVNEVNPKAFRVVTPYDEMIGVADQIGLQVVNGPSDYVNFTLLEPGEEVEGITITKEDLVYFEAFYTGFYYNDGDAEGEIMAIGPWDFESMAAESFWTHNKVISYQDNGLPAIVQLAPAYYMPGVGGWNNTQEDGMVTIVFPGVPLTDTSIDIAQIGYYTANSGDVSAVADVTLGNDVQEAKIAMAAGNDLEALLNGIIDGSVESISVKSSGEIKLPFGEDAQAGKYTILGITYADGTPAEYGSTTFTYNPATAESDWTLVGTGTYTYTVPFEDSDPGLELYVSKSDKTLYRIAHWCNDVDFYFKVAADGTITVQDSETGLNSQYGAVSVMETSVFFEDPEEAQSSYNNGVYTFQVTYYVGDQYLGYGAETFAVNKSAGSTAKAKQAFDYNLDNKYFKLSKQMLMRNKKLFKEMPRQIYK